MLGRKKSSTSFPRPMWKERKGGLSARAKKGWVHAEEKSRPSTRREASPAAPGRNQNQQQHGGGDSTAMGRRGRALERERGAMGEAKGKNAGHPRSHARELLMALGAIPGGEYCLGYGAWVCWRKKS